MSGVINNPKDELARCEERAKRLAMEKSYLQLVNNLMTQLSEVTGLETVVEHMLRIVLDNLGGTNVSLHYFMDKDLYSVDVFGRKRKSEQIADEVVKRVFATREVVEVEHDFRQTYITDPEFIKASTWAVPLMAGNELAGVLKLENMLLSAAEIRKQLEPFLRYSALVLKNEISGYARLKKAYDELSGTNARLSDEIVQRKEAESSLRITQFAVDHASDSLFLIRSDARFANVNDSTCRRLGYSRDELLAMTVFDVDPAFPREAWEAHWGEIKERGSFTIETMHRTKAGEDFPVEVTLNYVTYGGAEYNFAFARDITERRRAADALRNANELLEERVRQRTAELQSVNDQLQRELDERRQLEAKLRVMQFSVDNSADMVFWVRPDGSYVYSNKAACSMLGYSKEEFLRLKTFDLNPGHKGAAWKEHWEALRQKRFLRFEAFLARKDGPPVPAEITANHIEFEGQEYNCAFVRDITERKQAEKALRGSEERYRSLMQKVHTAIVLHDGDGRILDSNLLAQELLGLSADQLLGKSLIDPEWHFLREDGSILPVGEYPVSQVLSTRQPLRNSVRGVSRPDQADVAWLLVNAEPEYGAAGEIARVIVSFADITGIKKAEEELTKYREHLEELVKERTAEIKKKNAELERMNKLFVGRELRMAELKKRIKELEKKQEPISPA